MLKQIITVHKKFKLTVNIIKKIFVKTYYSLTKDDNIINRIKENKLYGINKTSTKYFDDILSSPRRRIK